MKHFIAVAALIPFIACSSAQKGSESTAPVAAASPSPAQTKATTPATAQKKDGSQKNVSSGAMEMNCKLEKDERTLILVPKDAGCELHYQKFGRGEVMASSQIGQRHCEEVRNRMQKNLETAGFTCK